MTEFFGWVVAIGFVVLFLFAADQYLLVKDIERDFKEYLKGVTEARDASEPPFRIHFNASVFALKHILGKYFKL